VDVEHVRNGGLTALYTAALNVHVVIDRALLEDGADANHARNDGYTALHAAASKGPRRPYVHCWKRGRR